MYTRKNNAAYVQHGSKRTVYAVEAATSALGDSWAGEGNEGSFLRVRKLATQLRTDVRRTTRKPTPARARAQAITISAVAADDSLPSLVHASVDPMRANSVRWVARQWTPATVKA